MDSTTAEDQPRPRHPWELLTEGTQRVARYAGRLLDEDRRIWIDWLRRFGIDPNDALVEPLFLVAYDDTWTLRYLGIAREPDGTPKMRGDEIERCMVTVQFEGRLPRFPGEPDDSASG
jgi:hypothetical protein